MYFCAAIVCRFILPQTAREVKEVIAEIAHESSVKNHITIEITTSKEELEKGYSHNT